MTTKRQSLKAFMYVGAILGAALEQFLLGDEDENDETETPVNKGAKHKDQSDLGEQHAAGHESDAYFARAFEFHDVGTETGLGMFLKIMGVPENLARVLANKSINRPTESSLGVESENESEETTDQLNESASR